MTQTFTCEKCGGSSYEQFSQTQVKCLHCGSISVYDTGYRVQKQFELSDNHTLDTGITGYIKASLPKRLVHYIVDNLFIVFLLYLIASLSGIEVSSDGKNMSDASTILFLAIFPCYYIFMEYRFGKTIGKFITGTKVINIDGTPLTFGKCVKRTLCRIIPLDQFSGLIFNGTFWHDSIVSTLVIEDN